MTLTLIRNTTSQNGDSLYKDDKGFHPCFHNRCDY